MSLYFLHHPESGALFTVDSEDERDAELENIELCEVSEQQYQALQAEYSR